METKGVSASRTTLSAVMMPRDANQYGFVFGGTVMALVDQAAFACAVRHARVPVVTASVDHMTFLRPVHVGDVIVVKASVNYVGRTSLEVGVRVEAERVHTGEVAHVGSAYLTMVALAKDGKPTPVIGLTMETEEDERRAREAGERRRWALARAGKTPPQCDCSAG